MSSPEKLTGSSPCLPMRTRKSMPPAVIWMPSSSSATMVNVFCAPAIARETAAPSRNVLR